MTSQQRTLINLPPPPADPVTPSDIPSRSGTPNSTTTSMSELSTVAIKDGHRGHLPHHHSAHSHHQHNLSSASNSAGGGGGSGGGSGGGAHTPTSAGPTAGQMHMRSQLDAERADRISRLAGLERVNTVRGMQAPGSAGNLTPGAAAPPLIAQGGQAGGVGGSGFAGAGTGGYAGGSGGAGGYGASAGGPGYGYGGAGAGAPGAGGIPPTVSYFDSSGNPAIVRERSTVGSASATGSVGARTTWAGSEAGDLNDTDKMSESQDMEMDGTASSAGGMSEDDGAATTGSLVGFGEGARTPARQSLISSPGGGSMVGVGGTTPSASKGGTPTPPSTRDAAMIDGLTYDRAGGVDSAAAMAQARAQTDPAVRANMNTTSNDRMMRGG